MKPVYLTLCKLNYIRRQFELDLYKALANKKSINNDIDFYKDNLNLSEAGTALMHKVHSMIYSGDMQTVLRMLYSFRFGAKRIKSNPYGGNNHENYYEYKNIDGNEKLSHKGNIPNAHFRWNYGERYNLSKEELNRIESFLGAIFPPDINYITRKK